ncbi:MAG: hypothetical protein IKL07_06915 [Clostridium sp.]|nr:hypothetical protein [Clostridium sp.]
MLRRRLGSGFVFCGLVLIILSFHANLFWNEDSPKYLSLKEAGLVYGLLAIILGIVLMIVNGITILQYLWLTWIGLMATQIVRIFGKETFVSHVMNSIHIFWGIIILGAILIVVSIWYKCRSIF